MAKKRKKPEKRGRGRPPLEDAQRRTERLEIRFSPDEMDEIMEVVENGEVSTWGRNLMLHKARSQNGKKDTKK